MRGGVLLLLVVAADPPKPAYTFGTLRPLANDVARAKLVAAVGVAAVDQAWSGERSAAENVLAALLAAKPEPAKLIAAAGDPDAPAPTAAPAFLTDTGLDRFAKSNLAAAYLQALSGRKVYEEALAAAPAVTPEELADPAGYLFHKAACEHALGKRDAANSTLRTLLDDVTGVPDRYRVVATLLYFDVEKWPKDEKDLLNLARLADNSQRRLDLGRGGPVTQEIQKKIVFRLDEQIKQAEQQLKQQQKKQQQAQGEKGGKGKPQECPDGGEKQDGTASGQGKPMDDSKVAENRGKGVVDEKKLRQYEAEWGKLPEAERKRVMLEIGRDLPPPVQADGRAVLRLPQPSARVQELSTSRIVVVALLLVPASGRADEVVTLAGQRTAGRLTRAGGESVGLKRDDGSEAQVSVRDLAAVELSRGPLLPADAKYDEIELTDGSTFRATSVLVKGTTVVADPLPAPGVTPPTVELPLRSVGWVMRNGHDPKNRTDWQILMAGRGKRDLFVVRQQTGLNPLPGTVVEGAPAGDRISFEREDGQRVSLPLTRASGGLVFNQPPQDDVPPTFCRLFDAHGNTWAATKIDLTGDAVTVTTPAGAVVRYPSRAAVRTLDFGRGNMAYLSDLALDVTYPPAEKSGPLAEQFPFAPKLILDGDGRLGGRTFAKGLAVPADVVLTAPVGEGFRTFRATVGVPDGAPPDAEFKLTVEADGRPLHTGTVKAGDPPRELSLNVADAKRLRVSVERTKLWAGDWLLLSDARFQK